MTDRQNHHFAHQISVIIATCNRAGLIRAAIESILRQSYQPLEIIVIDDGSTDDTAAVLQCLVTDTGAPIRYILQPNRGLPAAHNHGLRLVHGDIVAFLDSDDLWAEARLPAQLSCFQPDGAEGMAVGVVLGRTQRFVDGAKVNPTELAAANAHPFHYSLAGSLIARWVFDQVGGFDETFHSSADWDWFMRAREMGIRMAVYPHVTLHMRVHGGNMTQQRDVVNLDALRVVQNHRARTRKA